MNSRLALFAAAAAVIVLLSGCAVGGGSADTGSTPPTPSSAAPTSASTSAQSGTPKDVCAALPITRVNALTGLDFTTAMVVPTLGLHAAECQYLNAATVVDASDQLNALVVFPPDIDQAWSATQESNGSPGTPLSGVGKRAFTGDSIVAVDFGSMLIVVDDSASTQDSLDVDQLRFVEDELHNLYS